MFAMHTVTHFSVHTYVIISPFSFKLLSFSAFLDLTSKKLKSDLCSLPLVHIHFVDMGNFVHDFISNEVFLFLQFEVQIVSYHAFLLVHIYLVDMGNCVHDVISNEAFLFCILQYKSCNTKPFVGIVFMKP